jgi:hypothetical protein
MSDHPAVSDVDNLWPIERLSNCPEGTTTCLGCGALILDDYGAKEAHRWFHQALNAMAEKVLR